LSGLSRPAFTEVVSDPDASRIDLDDHDVLVPSVPLIDQRQDAKFSTPYTITFDMNETLLHTSDPVKEKVLGGVQIKLPDGKYEYVNLRPGVHDLLEGLQGKAELCVWTARLKEYASPATDKLNVDFDQYIFHDERWTHDWAKDLHRLGRDLDYVLHVDDKPEMCRKNPNNAVVIEPYFGPVGTDRRDEVLQRLASLFRGLLRSNMTVPEYLAKCAQRGLLQYADGFYRLRGWP